MDDLKTPVLKREMDRGQMASDAAVLRDLVGMLNDPRLSGAVVEKEEEPIPQPIPQSALPIVVPLSPQERKELPKSGLVPGTGGANKGLAADMRPTEIFFTGHSKVGKSWLATRLGARVFEFDDPIYALAAVAFGEGLDPALVDPFVREVRAWGNGEVSSRVPLTTTRAMFVEGIRATDNNGYDLFGISASEFGTPGFWVKSMLARISRFAHDLFVITNVTTSEQYRALVANGFKPYHVMCHPITRSKRGGTQITVPLIDGIERNVTQKISQAPTGGKLWCVWNDEKYPTPSSRLVSVQQFVAENSR